MTNTQELYINYQSKMQRIADIKNANAVLQWDQETYLPKKGSHFRGQQISTLSEIAHQLFSEEALGNLLQELLGKEDLSITQKRNIALTWEDYTKNKKYTSEFVRKLAEQTNKTFHAWIESRRQGSFSYFEKDLDALVELKKQETHILGFEQHPYNALLNEFEKGATVALLDETFTNLLPALKELLDAIACKPQVDDSFLHHHYPKDIQWEWGMFLIKELHFDFEAGRQDISEHPFSISFSPNDVRITTRINENDFGNMTWSCVHETGHALYEQNLPKENYGLPLGEACSYSIHESQSRLWENNVGRGLAFWQYYYPFLQKKFFAQLGNITLENFYSAINKVHPSLIRTEADEITYHFHVYIRYQLEKNLVEDSINTKDIPAYWNEQYKKWLDLDVPDDKKGCLQDVHWSHGSFGYFSTYSLGSFYATQFYDTANLHLKDLNKQISQGQTLSLLKWLQDNIHEKGRFYTPGDLCKEITGKTLDVQYFVNYLLEKYGAIYKL